jgi:hypothetical protein
MAEASKLRTVFIVVHDLPYGFQYIEEVFADYADAEKFIEDQHPYMEYKEDLKFWTYPDVTPETAENAESYKIEESISY